MIQVVSGSVLFLIIHYDRSALLAQSLPYLIPNIRDGDIVWLVDNGSSQFHACEAENAMKSLKGEVSSMCTFRYDHITVNAGGNKALRYAYNNLSTMLRPDITHLVMLGDDDFLGSSWRESVAPHLSHSNYICWGYSYFSWDRSESFPALIRNYTNSISVIAASVPYELWLRSISTLRSPLVDLIKYVCRPLLVRLLFSSRRKSVVSTGYGFQSHSSSTALPISALIAAQSRYGDIVTDPYGDVGFLYVLAEAQLFVYYDTPLGCIGRGQNYGMTKDKLRMAKNHPLPFHWHGIPSHSVYCLFAYMSILSGLRKEAYLPRVALVQLARHLYSCYIESPQSTLEYLKSLSVNGRGGIEIIKCVTSEVLLFLLPLLLLIRPNIFQRIISLWSVHSNTK